MKNLLLLTIVLYYSAKVQASVPVELDCLVKPEMYVDLSSSTDSVLKRLLVGPGDKVYKGQPVVELEASVERARVELAKQEVDSISEIENRKVQLKYVRSNNKRIRDLYAKQSTSLFELDKSNTELALAEIELKKARDRRKVARLRLELAQAQLDLKTIQSPIDGIVVDTYVMGGESVADRPIMKLAKINPLRVELIAPTEYFGLIHPDMEVEIQPERPMDKTYKATVSVVDQLIDPASGSFTVRMTLPNLSDELIGGVNCLARFSWQE